MRVLFLIWILYLMPALSLAKPPSVSTFLDLTSEYNDNIYWSYSSKKEDWINRIRPGISIHIPGYHKELKLNYMAGFEFFANHSEENTITHNANASASFQPTERLDLEITDFYSRSRNLAEVDIYGVGRRRETYWQNTVSPSLKYTFGPNRVFSCAYRYNIMHFSHFKTQNSIEHTATTGVFYGINNQNNLSLNYTFTHGEFESVWGNLNGHVISLVYEYLFSTHTRIYLTGSYSLRHYTASTDYKIYEGKVGINHAFSPQLSGKIDGGYFLQDPEIGSQSGGFTGSASLTYRYKRSQLNILAEKGYSEAYFTTVNLGYTTYWLVSINFSHQLTPVLNISINGSYNKNKFKFTNRAYKYWTGSVNLNYTPVKWFTAYLTYERTTLDADISVEGYTVNRVILGLHFVY